MSLSAAQNVHGSRLPSVAAPALGPTAAPTRAMKHLPACAHRCIVSLSSLACSMQPPMPPPPCARPGSSTACLACGCGTSSFSLSISQQRWTRQGAHAWALHDACSASLCAPAGLPWRVVALAGHAPTHVPLPPPCPQQVVADCKQHGEYDHGERRGWLLGSTARTAPCSWRLPPQASLPLSADPPPAPPQASLSCAAPAAPSASSLSRASTDPQVCAGRLLLRASRFPGRQRPPARLPACPPGSSALPCPALTPPACPLARLASRQGAGRGGEAGPWRELGGGAGPAPRRAGQDGGNCGAGPRAPEWLLCS